MASGAWSSAVSSLSAATRLARDAAERERFAAEAIEATMYAGDGATARRLVKQTSFADGPRRDSVLAYLAIFDGDVQTAQTLLARAWSRRGHDHRLAATVAQRSAFLSASRLRGAEAIGWARRGGEGRGGGGGGRGPRGPRGRPPGGRVPRPRVELHRAP